MIKGIRAGGTGPALSSLETLVVPIIENTPYEEDLEDSMAEVPMIIEFIASWCQSYPSTGDERLSRSSSRPGTTARNLCLGQRLGEGEDAGRGEPVLRCSLLHITRPSVLGILVQNRSEDEITRPSCGSQRERDEGNRA